MVRKGDANDSQREGKLSNIFRKLEKKNIDG